MPNTAVNLGDIATNNAKVSDVDHNVTTNLAYTTAASTGTVTSSDGTDATIPAATTTLAGLQTGADKTKLDGIEALADVTDTTNVSDAGAVMESDITTAAMGFVVDEDAMTSDSATKVPTQQSVKAYVDGSISGAIAGGVTFEGDYDAATNSPDLDATPIATLQGDMYVVSAAGTFFTIPVEIGDQLIAKQDTATLESHWSIVQANLTPATIKTQYESNADTNAFTDTQVTNLGNQSGTNTGDEAAASTTVAGIIELATLTETNTGAATNRAVTPASLAGIQTDVDTNTAKVGYTAALAKGDVVNDSITDGNLDTAPSENAVFDALALKLANVSEDTTPSLGGDLTLGANAIIHDADGMKRGSSAANFLEEEYIHAVTLSASQTNTVATEFTFPHASFEGAMIEYKIKEATTNRVRVGRVMVATDGTTVSISDSFTETADAGVIWNAAIVGADVRLDYTTGANSKTMRADMKRIKV